MSNVKFAPGIYTVCTDDQLRVNTSSGWLLVEILDYSTTEIKEQRVYKENNSFTVSSVAVPVKKSLFLIFKREDTALEMQREEISALSKKLCVTEITLANLQIEKAKADQKIVRLTTDNERECKAKEVLNQMLRENGRSLQLAEQALAKVRFSIGDEKMKEILGKE